MKRIILSLVVSFAALFAFAQSPQLYFMGIPLGQSYTIFKKQLLAKGFKSDGKGANAYIFKGTIEGKEEVDLIVFVTPQSKLVSSLVLNKRYEEYYSSSFILSKYDETIELLKKEYGMPSHGKRMDDKGDYLTIWSVGDNSISLTLKHSKDYVISLAYIDMDMLKLSEKEKELELLKIR